MAKTAKVVQLDFKNELLVGKTVLGNSNYGFKELCSDLLNDYCTNKRANQEVADGTFLSPTTIDRLKKLTETEGGEEYRPQSNTIERVLIFFGAEVHFQQIRISAKFSNKEKV